MSGFSRIIYCNARELQLFAIGLAFCLVAKGVALFPFAQSLDSYPKLVAMSQNIDQASGVFGEFVAQGRVGQWALHEGLAAAGIIGPGGNTFYVLVAMCAFSAAGVLLCKLWDLESDLWLSVCVVGLFTIHPYHAEIFTYREATITVALAQLLAVLGLVIADRRGGRWILGWVLLTLSLTLYQVAINFAVIALLLLGLVQWRRASMTWIPLRSEDPGAQAVIRTLVPRFLAVAGAVPAYYLCYQGFLKAVTGASSSAEAQRASGLAPGDVPQRLIEVLRTIKYIFVTPEPLMPALVKAVILLLTLMAVVTLAKRAWGAVGFSRWLELVVAGVLLLAACFGVVGILMGLNEFFALDRTLSAVSVLVAGLVAIVAVRAGARTRSMVFALVFALIVGFVGVNNVLLADQLRLNSRDREMANRIIMRLESAPGFSQVKKIAVIGRMREYPMGYYTATRISDVSTSAFSQPWSKANILREVSGCPLADPSSDELERARLSCRDVEPWPHPESVFVLDDMAVVCLSHEK